MNRIETLQAAIEAAKPKLKEISELEAQLNVLRDQAVAFVAPVTATLPEFTEEEEENEDDMEAELEKLNDMLACFAGDIGMVCTGNDGYSFGEWYPGEEVEFWVPSTC